MQSDPAGFGQSPVSYPPAGPGSLENLELRPARKRVRRQFILAAAVMGAMVVGATLTGEPLGIMIALILVAVVMTLLLIHVRIARIVVTAAEIRVSGLFHRRVRPRGLGARIVRATLLQPRSPAIDNVFVLDPQGKVLIRINGMLQEPEELDRLIAHLGLPATGPGHPVTPAELAKVHPGIVPFIERRPYVSGFAIAGLIIAGVILTGIVIAVAS